MRILLLEDDFEYQQSIEEYLISLGFEVISSGDGDSACKLLAKEPFHLLILDVKVPKIGGFEVLKYAREIGINAPVMMMTSLTGIKEITTAYELGCNEYLKKPFNIAELRLRVCELLRKHYNFGDKNSIKIARDFFYDSSLKRLTRQNIEIKLSQKELLLIDFLLSRLGQFCSSELLKDELWQDS